MQIYMTDQQEVIIMNEKGRFIINIVMTVGNLALIVLGLTNGATPITLTASGFSCGVFLSLTVFSWADIRY